MIRSSLMILSLFGVTLTAAALATPFVLLWPSPRWVQPLVGLWARVILGLTRLILGARIEVRGLHHLPPGGVHANGQGALIVGKHQSELDAIVLLALFPRIGAVAMRELDHYPLIGRFITALGYIKVRTDGGAGNHLPAVLSGSAAVLNAGRPLMIFPEGTLMELGARERYRSGVWHIYHQQQAPAYPMAVALGTIWPRRHWRKRCGMRGAVEFLPPIPPGLDKDSFMAQLEELLESRSMALIRELAHPDDLAKAEDRYARRANNDG